MHSETPPMNEVQGVLMRKSQPFAERLRNFCEKQNEDPAHMFFSKCFEELRIAHHQSSTPLKALWEFMVADARDSGKPFDVNLPTFRRWWYEKAPEDKKSRKKAQSKI